MMPTTCFVIQRQVTKTYLATHHNHVMAFENKEHARRFLRAYTDMRNNKKEQQLVIVPTPLDKLSKRCALSALTLCHVDEQLNMITMDPLDHPTDDYLFHLEHTLWYA